MRWCVLAFVLVSCGARTGAGAPALDAATRDAGMIACGETLFCDPTTTYCRSNTGSFRCASLPAPCAASPTCECVVAQVPFAGEACVVARCDVRDGLVVRECDQG